MSEENISTLIEEQLMDLFVEKLGRNIEAIYTSFMQQIDMADTTGMDSIMNVKFTFKLEKPREGMLRVYAPKVSWNVGGNFSDKAVWMREINPKEQFLPGFDRNTGKDNAIKPWCPEMANASEEKWRKLFDIAEKINKPIIYPWCEAGQYFVCVWKPDGDEWKFNSVAAGTASGMLEAAEGEAIVLRWHGENLELSDGSRKMLTDANYAFAVNDNFYIK